MTYNAFGGMLNQQVFFCENFIGQMLFQLAASK